MNSELTRTEIEECRAALHRLVDEHFDLALQSLKTGEPLPQMETVLPLSTAPRRFKGTKPAVIIFPMVGGLRPPSGEPLSHSFFKIAQTHRPTVSG